VPQDTGPKASFYRRLGVRPFINCCGARTVHGGTLMLPQVIEAMNDAAQSFVNLTELAQAAGRRIAELTGAEWGMVASGASAALCHAAAAAVAGADPEKMFRLPKLDGMPRRAAMLNNGRFAYDHALRMVGVDIVEVGSRAELDTAFAEPVAFVCLLGTAEASGPLRLEEVVALAKPRGVPVLVDAASEHLAKPEPYLARGATMVAYSGGKYLRGPQSTGLLLGERAWVEAAWRNGAPHHGFGRAMKVSKEEIAGLIAALEYWAEGRDHNEERDRWYRDLDTILREAGKALGISGSIREPKGATERVPLLELSWDANLYRLDRLALRETLLSGEPRIMLDDRFASDHSVFVNPFSLFPDQAEIVGSRIREALKAAPRTGPKPEPAKPAIDLSGRWTVDLAFVKGSAQHRFDLLQSGNRLSGRHRTLALENPVSGTVEGDAVTLASLQRFEGTNLAYRFFGRVNGNRMEGEAELGQHGQSAPGPLNQREYGRAKWTAIRSS
jgi:L-seryl-tRNA(Ser) seleniumtransferase